eukprot:1232060-Rhodomonas_salina.2
MCLGPHNRNDKSRAYLRDVIDVLAWGTLHEVAEPDKLLGSEPCVVEVLRQLLRRQPRRPRQDREQHAPALQVVAVHLDLLAGLCRPKRRVSVRALLAQR